MGRRGRKRSPFKMKLRVETLYSLGSLVCFAAASLLIISFSGEGQTLQAVNDVLRESFGIASIVLPFLLITAGFVLTGAKWSFAKPQVLLGSFLFFLSVLVLAQSGRTGEALFSNFADLIQPLGVRIVFSLVGLAGFFIFTDTSLRELGSFVFSAVEIDSSEKIDKKEKKRKSETLFPEEAETEEKKGLLGGIFAKKKKEEALSEAQPDSDGFVIQQHKLPTTDEPLVTSAAPLSNDPGAVVWDYPPLSLLSEKKGKSADRGDVKKNAQTIEYTLDSFGVQTQVKEVNYGPAVTQYAIQINTGTKLTKITSLANDLALALAAPTGQIRIEAPIPGRSLVGIEIPNRSLEVVTLRTMLTSPEMKENKSKLAVALGLSVEGKPMIADIGKMPHALIAGSTGSGKSVAVNAFIASILYRATPQEVKFIMVDPKRVELTQYNGIPHLLSPVITEAKKVVNALRWACAEMDNRYKVFAEVGVRNLASYNQMAGFQAMPYIVIVIDELADLMLFAPTEVEELITRIAQMARAVGIHLLLATQRPSVDVITGLIKANVPTRIAFNVSSGTDSRVILDTPGAEKLLGKGDMLYIPPDEAKPRRIQGTFVSDQELSNLITFIRQQGQEPEYQEDIISKYDKPAGQGGTAGDDGDVDNLYDQAVQIVLETEKASASYLQRRLSLGYTRAARIIDQMQEAGLVSHAQGAKPREMNRAAAQQYLASKNQA